MDAKRWCGSGNVAHHLAVSEGKKRDLIFVADGEDGLEILQSEITTKIIPGFKYAHVFFPFVLIILFSRKKRTSKRYKGSVSP